MGKRKKMNIIFDLDSTLVTIEGIDELGAMKKMRNQIEALTNAAMSGGLRLDHVFEERLNILQPTKNELEAIGKLYLENITPHAKQVISELKKEHRIFIVTGGYEICTIPISNYLGVQHVFANKILYDDQANYQELDKTIPLWQNDGKKKVINQIKAGYPEYTIMIGDGQSDLDANADKFIYFAGVVKREIVAKQAKHIIHDLREVFDYLTS